MIVCNKHFTAHFHFVGWECISLGLSVDVKNPNLELHLPFGFFRLGWTGDCFYNQEETKQLCSRKRKGWVFSLNNGFGWL